MIVKYKKLLSNGQEVYGQADYFSLDEAQKALAAEGEVLLELKVASRRKSKKLNLQERLDFTYQMYQLVSAGLPIYESLLSLKEKQAKLSDVIEGLINKIKQGKSFSCALSDFPESFDPLYIAIVTASEASGEMKNGLFELKTLLEKQVKLKKILKGALTYPIILLFFSFAIVNGLIFFIIPSLSELFEGRQVNGLTSLILGISRFCLSHIFELVLSACLLGLGIYFAALKGILGRGFRFILLKMPFAKDLIMDLKFENFFACMSLLLNRGINLKESLILSRQVLNHNELEKSVDEMMQAILKGQKFSDSIKPPFPHISKRLISLAEETGKLGSSCEMLSSIFHEGVEKKLIQLTTFLQPILLAFIGFIIGIVILSIMMPLTDVGGFI
jgi:general secretion pathway protein F